MVLKRYNYGGYYVRIETRSYGYCTITNAYGLFNPLQEKHETYKEALNNYNQCIEKIKKII